MTADTAAEALLQIAVNNIASINSNNDIMVAGLSLSTEAGTDPNDSSPHRRLTVGDRQTVPDGLSLCFIPVSDHIEQRQTGRVADVTLRVEIVTYMRAVRDPEKVRRAKRGIAEELTGIFTFGCDEIVTPSGVIYNGRITERTYHTFNERETRMGQVIHAVALSWTGSAFIPS